MYVYSMGTDIDRMWDCQTNAELLIKTSPSDYSSWDGTKQNANGLCNCCFFVGVVTECVFVRFSTTSSIYFPLRTSSWKTWRMMEVSAHFCRVFMLLFIHLLFVNNIFKSRIYFILFLFLFVFVILLYLDLTVH